MKRSQLVWTAIALWAAAWGAGTALACDQNSSTSASAQTSGATVAAAPAAAHDAASCATAHNCSASQAAACKASGMTCSPKSQYQGTSAAKAGSASAVAAAAPGAASAAASHCTGEGAAKFADQSEHADCDACADMAHCAAEIAAAGARVQVVPLKNGVMYVYTVESSAGVRAVQAAVSHRNERLASWLTAGDKVHLCSKCKEMRGAAASGKLSREVVNIEGGCLTLMTSTDPQIVQRLHEMAATPIAAARNTTKS